jgi:hypothetical protein
MLLPADVHESKLADFTRDPDLSALNYGEAEWHE